MAEKKKRRSISTFAILLAVLLVVSIVTWIASGQTYTGFDEETGEAVEMAVEGASLSDILMAPIAGWHDAGDVIGFVFCLGAFLSILNATGALETGIQVLVKKLKGKELVLVNLHLEAYDDGEGKAAQTKVLADLLTAEYEKGNYVIAGGDFNQTFPGALDAFPIRDPSLWTPGVLEADILPEGWQFACDLSVPTCRLLNQPYDPDSGDTQFYVIDGFILSPNVRLDSVETIDRQFQYADHNPVLVRVTLEP